MTENKIAEYLLQVRFRRTIDFLYIIVIIACLSLILLSITLLKADVAIGTITSSILLTLFSYLMIERAAAKKKIGLQVTDYGFSFEDKAEIWYWEDVKWFKIKEQRRSLRMILSIKMNDGTRFDFPQNYPFDCSEDIDEYIRFYDDMNILLPRCTQKSNVFHPNKGLKRLRRAISILTVLLLTYRNRASDEFISETLMVIMILTVVDFTLPFVLEVLRKRNSAQS
ncbi:hypothetical protein K5X82_08905 [Halosquirtibacter xylanolyticus]|uniref:hypothetical protein n=1 Tax=Halosquirtibacter xylanolyticus TaxID=3374599 RepID=UPI0037494F35|nr:hypothetical protein K5X82_08905 [Prolixibacteraceae bacterium]